MVKYKIACFCLFLLLSFFSLDIFAQVECKVGIYVTRLYDFEYEEKSFAVDFWLWALYTDDTMSFENTFEVANAKSQESVLTFYEKVGDYNWLQEKIKAVIHHDWNLSSFPFDSNILELKIENILDESEVVLVCDTESSILYSISNEWGIESFSAFEIPFVYDSNYGNPNININDSTYSQINIQILIKRSNSWLILFKLLIGVYIAFLISLIPFGMKPGTDSRLAIPAASLFAVVGNKYITDSIIPMSISMTLLDQIYTLTFIALILIFAELMISDNMRVDADTSLLIRNKFIDHFYVFSLALLYAFLNVFLIYQAL